jgi:MFS superfamily sulfate permease-like transporter
MPITPINRNDFLSSLSLLLVSLPLSAGIAVASGAAPEAGIISAIFGALFFGCFSSSPLAVFGPSAGLSIFLSTSTKAFGDFSQTSAAIVLAGVFLMLLSYVNVHRIINIFPRSVTKGMVAGIGLILAIKMIPHLLGYDRSSLFDDKFSHGKSNTLSDLFISLESILPGAFLISILSLALMIGFHFLQKKGKLNFRFSGGVLVVVIGVVLNLIFQKFAPDFYLSGEHLLHVTSTRIRFKSFLPSFSNLPLVIETALIITAVIILEGFITLDIFQKIDPLHSRIKYKKEMILLGVGNCLMGLIGALPLMPVLIRSTANVNFGAKTRNSVIFHGIWLALALNFKEVFSFIPMASVAAVLFTVGIGLLDFKEIKKMIVHGYDHYVPFFLTIGFIFFFDLLWGIAAGFMLGLIFTLRSSFQRSMVLVNDTERYLLKFHKDVTFLHKGELREHLDAIPQDKEILIDGTGNIFIDKEIEEWLEDFADECHERGCKVTFMKSRLAVSKLFKEI